MQIWNMKSSLKEVEEASLKLEKFLNMQGWGSNSGNHIDASRLVCKDILFVCHVRPCCIPIINQLERLLHEAINRTEFQLPGFYKTNTRSRVTRGLIAEKAEYAVMHNKN
jgi:hypothetical protein